MLSQGGSNKIGSHDVGDLVGKLSHYGDRGGVCTFDANSYPPMWVDAACGSISSPAPTSPGPGQGLDLLTYRKGCREADCHSAVPPTRLCIPFDLSRMIVY